MPDALLASARWVHVASPFLQPALGRRGRSRARAAGTTSLDPGWDPRERWELAWEGFDVLLPNAQEAQRLAGEEDVEAAARRLARGPPVAVSWWCVKLGAPAARRSAAPPATARRPMRASACAPRVEPVDATGAGDSFDAGFLAARLAGEDLAGALALGCACGALSTRAAGGTAGQPTLAEARSFRA